MDEITDEVPVLTIKIEYKDSLLLSDFYESLEGWNSQYCNYIAQNIPKDTGSDKLYIKSIKQGSIEIALISSLIPLLTDYNTVFTFFSSIRIIFEWLKSKIGGKPKLEITDLENIKKIISPIYKSKGNQLFVSIAGNNNTVVLDNLTAQKMSNNIDEEIIKLSSIEKKEGTEDVKENVILKLNQLRNDSTNRNTKGIVQEINGKTYPVVFDSGLKDIILHDDKNPFKYNYLVDLKVNKTDDDIKSYTVLKIKDTYIDEDEKDAVPSLF